MTLASFLRATKAAVTSLPAEGRLHVVMGNEAMDLEVLQETSADWDGETGAPLLRNSMQLENKKTQWYISVVQVQISVIFL